MKITISFILFSTPTEPFAIIEGWMDVEGSVAKGDYVKMEWPNDLADGSGNRCAQEIKYIIEVKDKHVNPGLGVGDLYSLEDVVMDSQADAEKVAEFWKQRYGLHVITYELIMGNDEERET